MRLSPAELAAAERSLGAALRSGDTSHLEILGWGELSMAIGFDAAAGPAALKWLPPFGGPEQWQSYRALFDRYRSDLADSGVAVLDSELQAIETGHGLLGVCVQPRLPASAIGPRVLSSAPEAVARDAFETIFEHVVRVVGPRLGLDAQLSNWAFAAGRWSYLDLTTPLVRDEHGHDLLEAGLFLAALPRLLRPIVRAFLLRGILSAYHSPRRVALDLLANLCKERLERWLPLASEVAGDRFGARIDAAEARAHYRADARMWAGLLALRRFDRALHRRALRRLYPFLLPGPIER